MKTIERRVIAVNIFGVIGYALLMTTWVLFVGMAMLSFFQTPPVVPEEVVGGGLSVGGNNAEPSQLIVVLGYVFAVLAAIVAIGILLTFPYFLAKWLARVLRWSMSKLKIETSRRHLFLAKGILATLPLLGFLALSVTAEPVSMVFSAVYIATVCLSVITMVLFFTQLLLARRLRVFADKTW